MKENIFVQMHSQSGHSILIHQEHRMISQKICQSAGTISNPIKEDLVLIGEHMLCLLHGYSFWMHKSYDLEKNLYLNTQCCFKNHRINDRLVYKHSKAIFMLNHNVVGKFRVWNCLKNYTTSHLRGRSVILHSKLHFILRDRNTTFYPKI